MAIAPKLDPGGDHSPLAAARVKRQLTVEEAARRAGLTPDEVTWLEEARVYRFPSTDAALLATLLYATALGIDQREARSLAGLPVGLARVTTPRGRILGFAAVAVAALALGAVFVLREDAPPPDPVASATLPPPWKIDVVVLNGSGDIVRTRQIASRIGALAYHVSHVGRADRFDYPQTTVYYEPGGAAVAIRLARQLGVITKPLPGGSNPRRLVVITGPRRGP